MSTLMYSETAGFHHISDDLVEEAKSNGWVDGKTVLAARKRETVASDTKPATIAAQPEVKEVKRSPGRPRKEVPSVLNDGEV